ncbi:tail fiber domain-containing protein [Helcococcus bovis]|uniref:tail fiber domain-containing protein n=1 Tax=Helcococcus bovis TaxID=3153252 RepID=UPI0038BB089C
MITNEKLKELFSQTNREVIAQIKIGNVVITSRDKLKEFKVSVKADDDKGQWTGTAIPKELKFSVINENRTYDNLIISGQEVEAIVGVRKTDSSEDYSLFSLGKYYIDEEGIEVKEDKGIINVIAYDKLKEFQSADVGNINYPITIKELLNKVQQIGKVEIDDKSLLFPDFSIQKEIYFGKNKSLSNVIKAIAGANLTFAVIDYDGNLVFKRPIKVDYEINKENAFNFKKFGKQEPITTVVIARTPQEDNVMYELQGTQPNNRVELKLANNPILDLNREYFIKPLLDIAKTWEYIGAELRLQSNPLIEIGDIVQFDGNDVLVLEHEITMTRSIFKSKVLEKNESDYSKAKGIEEQIKDTVLYVDKVQSEIVAKVKNDFEKRIVELKLDDKGITQRVGSQVDNKISSINQTLEDIKISFSNEKKKNYIVGTESFKPLPESFIPKGVTYGIDEVNGDLRIWNKDNKYGKDEGIFYPLGENITLNGQTLTISGQIYSDFSSNTKLSFRLENDWRTYTVNVDRGSYKPFNMTFKVGDNGKVSNSIFLQVYNDNYASGKEQARVFIKGSTWKLEDGNKATKWTPADSEYIKSANYVFNNDEVKFTYNGIDKLKFNGKNGDLTLTGYINARGGSIGDWEITDKYLRLKNDRVGIGIGSYSSDSAAFWAGYSGGKYNFLVTHSGNLTANNATIKGYIEASSGWIGNWKITDKYLMSSNERVGIGTASYSSDSAAFWAGYGSGRYNFLVTHAGDLTARSGRIGGTTVNANSLSGGTYHSGTFRSGSYSGDTYGYGYLNSSSTIAGHKIENRDDSLTLSRLYAYNGLSCSELSINSGMIKGLWNPHVKAYVTATLKMGGWDISNSDIRLKENIEDLGYEYNELIYNLPLIKYNYIEDKEKKQKAGVNANYLMKILPKEFAESFLHQDKKTGLYGASYEYLTPYLIKVVQEQNERIKELEKWQESCQ